MIPPTVGRIVYYFPRPEESGMTGPLPAIVTRVVSDACVDLQIFTGRDNLYSRGGVLLKQSVQLVQPEDETTPDSNYCCWMPYQQGQAAKTDDLSAKALAGLELLAERVAVLENLLAVKDEVHAPPAQEHSDRNRQEAPLAEAPVTVTVPAPEAHANGPSEPGP